MADPVLASATAAISEAAGMSAALKAALPALTVMGVNAGIDILVAVLILIAGWVMARWLSNGLRRALARNHRLDSTIKPLLVKGVSYLVMALTLVAVLGRFGVQTTSIIALLGAAGLAVGLALQGTLSNVASGVMLLVLRPLRVGDAVEVAGGTGGTVREIGLFNTEMVSGDGIFVCVPNSQIFSNVIINYTREETRRINITVRIDHDDDIAKAQGILLAIMTGDARVLKDPAPIAPVNELSASSVDLLARCFVPNALYWDVLFDMQKAIKLAMREAGITMPYPQQTASVRQPVSPP